MHMFCVYIQWTVNQNPPSPLKKKQNKTLFQLWKETLKQWWSTIPPTSTKSTIFSHLKSLNKKDIATLCSWKPMSFIETGTKRWQGLTVNGIRILILLWFALQRYVWQVSLVKQEPPTLLEHKLRSDFSGFPVSQISVFCVRSLSTIVLSSFVSPPSDYPLIFFITNNFPW